MDHERAENDHPAPPAIRRRDNIIIGVVRFLFGRSSMRHFILLFFPIPGTREFRRMHVLGPHTKPDEILTKIQGMKETGVQRSQLRPGTGGRGKI